MDPKHIATMDTAAESTPDPRMAATVDSRPRQHGPVLGRGALIGRYLVLGDLGAGAMGVVYAAHDPELDRTIALKFLKSGLDGSDARARLLREAQSMARLAHPNVVTVHDVGTFGDEVFVAMEFVQGVTLTHWLASKPRGWREVLEVFIAAGRGLKAAHDAGLVHRDLKPDNIMVGDDGRVRVMDFGLARAGVVDVGSMVNTSLTDAPALQHLTRPGSLLGTPAYMAPEQWEGTGVDARADQFAYCVALWEGLYGERPFHGKSLASLMTVVTSGQKTEPSDPKRAPQWLRRVLDRGLATKADARWPSMDALLRELTRDRLARTRRWLALGLGVMILVAGGLGVKQVLDKQASAAAERERADVARQEALRAAALANDRLSTANTFVERILSEALPDLDRVAGSARVRKQLYTSLADIQATLLPDRSPVRPPFQRPVSSERVTAIARFNDGIGIYKRDGNNGGVEKAFLDAIQIDPTYADAYHVLGQFYREQNRMADAERSLQSAVDNMDPEPKIEYSEYFYDLGTVQASRAEADGVNAAEREAKVRAALESFRESLKLDPTLYKAHYRIGTLYERLDEPRKADAAYRQAIEVMPSFSPAFVSLANMYLDYGFADDAIALLHKGAQINDKDPRMWNGLGRAYFELGKMKDAIEAYSKAKALDPDDVNALYGLGMANAELGLLQEARENLEHFLAKADDNTMPGLLQAAHDTIARLSDGI